jgi:hypothetical protein
LNRIFSFEAPPVPVLANWNRIEEAWPNLQDIRAKLSANKTFAGDVCAISGPDSGGSSQGVTETNTPGVAISIYTNYQAHVGWTSYQPAARWVDGEQMIEAVPPCRIKYDPASQRILPDSTLAKLCLGDSIMGFRSIVSQIAPTGGGSFEDVQVMDTTDSALVIVTRAGDDIVVYRRIFHAD